MSATSHDAIPEFPGKVLRIDAPEPAPASAAPDFTEDLADEITSELAPASRRKTAAPATRRRIVARRKTWRKASLRS